MTTLQQLDSFNAFVRNHLIDHQAEVSLDQIFYEWRLANPTAAESQQIHEGLVESECDIKELRVRPQDIVLAELHAKYDSR